MTPIVIIGCGAASLLLLFLFQTEGIPAHHITIIDPFFDGGDLQRTWSSVKSNTHWRKFYEAMISINPAWKATETEWNLDETLPLSGLIRALREAVNPFLLKCEKVVDRVTSVIFTDCWEIQTHTGEKIQGQLLFLCTGSDPKSLNLPIPTIPLQNALSPFSLQSYVEPKHKILLFGTAHSGTLVIDSLLKVGCRKIYAVYRHEKPFLFAKDGEYDGIKEESEQIANRLLTGQPKELEFVHEKDVQKMAKALRSVDWVIYAIGFAQRKNYQVMSGGTFVSLEDYDPMTGKLPTAGPAWGFGIAFPNRAPDGKHYDVSLHSFAQHILNQKAEMLEKYRSIASTKITNT